MVNCVKPMSNVNANSNMVLKELIEQQYGINQQMVDGLKGINETTKALLELSKKQTDNLDNNNKLMETSSELLRKHTEILTLNTEAVKNMERFWGKIMFILVLAIITLAGADKLLPVFFK